MYPINLFVDCFALHLNIPTAKTATISQLPTPIPPRYVRDTIGNPLNNPEPDLDLALLLWHEAEANKAKQEYAEECENISSGDVILILDWASDFQIFPFRQNQLLLQQLLY